ncbi:MAG: hypothetical protein ACUVYA_08910 [Planctomycetota bacterium]
MESGNAVRALCLAVSLFLPVPGSGASGPEELAPGGLGVGERIEALERRIAELEAERLRAPAAPSGSAKDEKESILATLGVQLYGYLKLDAAFDTSRVDVGDYARWVFSEGGDAAKGQARRGDAQFSLTANQTRLGLRFTGPAVAGAETGGLFEIDFYGGGAENKPNPMMRKAYLTVAWPDLDVKLLAGQDADLISPLVPETVNYTVLWWVGNIGYRRAQFRATKGFDLGRGARFELAAAATRTVGTSTAFETGADTGEDAGFPTAQGRAALSFPLLTSRPTTLGVSGHFGREEYDAPGGVSEKLDSWSVNCDATIPVLSWLSVKGEGFLGANLDEYLGGIGQGLKIVTADLDSDGRPDVLVSADEVRSYGGWILASAGPFGGCRFNAGASIDAADPGDLKTGERKRNLTYLGNVFYRLYEAVEVALEVSYWRTEYVGAKHGDALRVQTALIFNF